MPKKIIPLVVGETYHIFNRGTDKRIIFLSKSDYLRFYQSLDLFNTTQPIINFDSAKIFKKNNQNAEKLVKIIAYCLLPNHFHLLLTQNIEGGISEFMKRVSGGYTSYFNLHQERSGVLFQGVFKRVHVNSQSQFNYLMAYINENHFVHGIDLQREICHTSSLFYQGLSKSSVLSDELRNQTNYSVDQAILLVNDIFTKRRSANKSFVTLE